MAGLIVALVLSYAAGSFPSSLVLGKLLYGRDVRREGSGNAGSTNAARVFGAGTGIAVAVLDVGKGLLAALAISLLGRGTGLSPSAVSLLCGSMAVCGHVWPVFAGFRGGKGVATSLGVLFPLAPAAGLLAFVAFVTGVGLTGFVSVGSLAAAAGFGLAVLLGIEGSPPDPWLAWTSLGLTCLILYTHRANIRRLAKGGEHGFDSLKFSRLLARAGKKRSGPSGRGR